MTAPVLLSVNVGQPRNVTWQGKTVYTGIWKHPVPGRGAGSSTWGGTTSVTASSGRT
jgi:hypothetical protein